MTAALQIVTPGVATTVQDGGRPGLAHIGVPASGMVDPVLGGTLNRLVGNPSDAAVIETAGGLRVRALTTVVVASSVEPAPVVRRAGEEFGVPADGRRQWHYLVVRGGLAVPSVLGSRSTDTLSGLGPPPPVVGDVVAVGDDPTTEITTDIVPLRPVHDRVRAFPGPRADWFVDGWRDELTGRSWSITASSRVGVRLRGGTLARARTDELPSEGLIRGAIQVPPDGDPVMMLADHPTTGGYPVIAVVHPDDVALVAQHLGGTAVRFRL